MHYCPDCGGAQTNHAVAHASVLLDWTLSPYGKIVDWISRGFDFLFPLWWSDSVYAQCFNVLTWIGFARWEYQPKPGDSDRSKVLRQAAQTRGIPFRKLTLLGRPTELCVARVGTRQLVFDAIPRPFGVSTTAAGDMDDKGWMLRRFGPAGIPVARGGVAFRRARARKLFSGLTAPVVVKPNFGSRSRHTFMHVASIEQLESAFKSAKQLSPWVVIEEELVGPVFRATVIGGKLIGVMRRDPPQVLGDGVSSIVQLVARANIDPRRHGPVFHEIHLGDAAQADLRRQGLTLHDIPMPGQWVVLGSKVGRGDGGTNADVTDSVHPDNKMLFERVQEVLRDPVVGIDFIIEDITKSWREQNRLGVIECNSMPFVDLHHFPFDGKPRDAAGALWDYILSTVPR